MSYPHKSHPRALKFKLMAIVFAGLHLPLTAIAVYALLSGNKDMLPLVGVAFASTLIAALGTLGLMYRLLPDESEAKPLHEAFR